MFFTTLWMSIVAEPLNEDFGANAPEPYAVTVTAQVRDDFEGNQLVELPPYAIVRVIGDEDGQWQRLLVIDRMSRILGDGERMSETRTAWCIDGESVPSVPEGAVLELVDTLPHEAAACLTESFRYTGVPQVQDDWIQRCVRPYVPPHPDWDKEVL